MATKNKIAGLDGIRTLGLIGVILYHTFPAQIPGGYFGVVCFFVLSGFLSGMSINRQIKEKSFHLLQYYKKRFLRIYPSIIIVLFCTVGAVLLIQPVKLANTQSEVLSILFNYNNYWQISMHADYFANLAQNSPFTHMWYMSILLQFELICPFVCLAYAGIKNKKGVNFSLALLFLLCVGLSLIMPLSALTQDVSLTALYYRTDCRIAALFLGLYGGIAYSENKKLRIPGTRNRIRPEVWTAAVVIISVLLFLFASGSQIWVYQFGLIIYSYLIFFMLDAQAHSNKSGKILDNKLTGFLSKYSYEIYLWQYPVLFLASISGYSGIWYDYCAQLAVILVLSLWLHTFVKGMAKKYQH